MLYKQEFGGFPGSASGKEFACQCGKFKTCSSIIGLERSPGGENGNSLQISCLENLKDRGAWRAIVHGVTKSCTGLKQLNTHTHIYQACSKCSTLRAAPKYRSVEEYTIGLLMAISLCAKMIATFPDEVATLCIS